MPPHIYKNEWKGWGNWLGSGNIAPSDRVFLSYSKSKQFVSKLGLKNWNDWSNYCKSGKNPPDIPSNPNKSYKKQWRGWGDWLGTGYVANQNREFRSFKNARGYIQSLRLESKAGWGKYSRSARKPKDIPSNPSHIYKKQWRGWGDWLGTGRIADQDKVYRSFEEAKKFVRSLRLQNTIQWDDYCKSGKKPEDIPANAPQTYKDKWTWWSDWLGYEETGWSVRKVKELLRDLINTKIIFQWTEAVLYSFLLRKGVLSLDSNSNRHAQFFKNLIEASRTVNGRKVIDDYANSDSEIPPNLSNLIKAKTIDPGEEIQTASTQEVSQLADNADPLDYGENQSVEQILTNTSILESINVDKEAMQFYLTYSVDELWKSAFRDERSTVGKIKLEGENGNKYHDTVVNTFLSDHERTKSIQLPYGYNFRDPHSKVLYCPTLMQYYVAYKVKSLPFFGNFSGTGAGKTLSAVLASRIINSKMTLIVCPNDVVGQWARNTVEIFPDSVVITGKESFYATYDKAKYQYLVLNYDKFSQEDSPNLILNLVKQKVDFVVLDEIHFTKIRHEEDVSIRRQNLDGLVTAVRKKNGKVKVLGLSATPVVNNLTEGKSLLELITGKIYDDIATRPTVPNAVTLYEKLSTISIRELPRYDTHVDDSDIIGVQAERPHNIKLKQLKSNPLAIEQFLTDARIPEIIGHIEGQTIIYTEYVTNIIEKLSHAVEAAGYSYALYTGTDHSGLKRFLDKKVQVMIASRPISVGVDGLQKICNRLIINTLPWTNAQYQQLLGRLVRKGQIKDVVHVYVIKASIGGYPYDEIKWKRIQFKRTLADCAVDGRLPEKNLVTPQQAALEAVKWLERLERGEISSVTRRDLNVKLTPVEIKHRIRKYGDFTRLNNKINTENSDSTHRRMQINPQEWEEYHRQYREARKAWSVIPYEEIIKRIKELSSRLQVGDFGCGEAKIVGAIGKDRVYSFDHVAINDSVTACDMKSVPLPNDALDIAVFSLSLMCKNWPDYISEAKRCLATNGYLLIAETTKSLSASGRLSRLRDVIKENGFEIYNDEQRGDFTFIEAREL